MQGSYFTAGHGLGLTCRNCGADVHGPFCSHCGQRVLRHADPSLGRYLRESLAVLTNADSRVVRSFVTLLFRPGQLTAEYTNGRRASYLQPLQLFLLCNVFFFIAQSVLGFNTLSTPLRVHLEQLPYSPFARGLVADTIARRDLSMDEYRLLFDATVAVHAKTLVIIMVPLLGLFLHGVLWSRRRYFVEHLVFATHFFAFFLLILPIFVAALIVIGETFARFGDSSRAVMIALESFFDFGVFFVVYLPYLYLAIRRAYDLSRTSAGVRAVLMTFSVIAVLQLYRLFLFFTTYSAI
jgi:hypothetical protein